MRWAPLLLLLASVAHAADPVCRLVETSFKPSPGLQIAVWIEDDTGKYIDTAFISRSTGSLGLANRPGSARFKTDFRFPYGRRDMVLPVWAHARNVKYGLVVMGGRGGNSQPSCMAGGIPASECDDATIGYHFAVSSPESFYCSPRGGFTQKINGVDVTSCASPFYGCKGAYADPPAFSLYPPRSDLVNFVEEHDGQDARGFATVNDLGAISGATPPGHTLLDPPLRWFPPKDGRYVMKIELSAESDFNMYHRHPNMPDAHAELNGYGHDFLGQPSVVYAVPFTVGDQTDVEIANDYAGYGDWDGATGELHAPDLTISTMDNSGAGRLLLHSDASGSWRVKVRSLPDCNGMMPNCRAPEPPTGLVLEPMSNAIQVRFASASSGTPAARFDVRYREARPINDSDFLTAVPGSFAPPAPGAQGSQVSTLIGGLRPEVSYTVAVRAISMCDSPSPVSTAQINTKRSDFTVLHGCFIATAAYGSSLARELDRLRTFRDRHLLTNPAGQLATAIYYTFGPALARAIAADEWLRAGARALIMRVR